jgi:pilus assembly protein CpaD
MKRAPLSTPLMLALAGVAILGGCASAAGMGPAPLTPLSRYSLRVEPGVDRIALAVHESGLSANQRGYLAALAARFGHEEAEVMRIDAPSGGDPVAAEAAYGVRAALVERGVPAHRILMGAYDAPDPRAPILAGFETLRAHVPECGTAWGDLTSNASNRSSSNLGCAINANLAAQISNPRDIIAPRDLGPGDAGRRAVVFDNYRQGTITSAPQEPLVEGRVSQAVD